MRHEGFLGLKVAGRFTIKRLLGEGGMASVYVAERDAEPREVALKIMDLALTSDRAFLRRFQREAKAASRVKHPNSVKIFEYGVDGRLSYIVMELLVGGDLYSLLERDGVISQRRAVRLLADVCDALTAAHEMGIVHRDLKPENIVVVPDLTHPHGERVKVLDFGIAKVLELDGPEGDDGRMDSRIDPTSAITRAGQLIGTPAYMSPEQCGLLPVDPRSDIYTCGVLLYQLVTGRLPFEGATPLHTATLHIHSQLTPPSAIAPRIDRQLEALIVKALSKKPTDRPQTARHLGAALRKLIPELPDVSVGEGAEMSMRQTSSMWPREVPPPPEPSLGSAKTMISSAEVGPPPSVLLHQTPLPPPLSREPASTPAPTSGGPPASARAASKRPDLLPPDAESDFVMTRVRGDRAPESSPTPRPPESSPTPRSPESSPTPRPLESSPIPRSPESSPTPRSPEVSPMPRPREVREVREVPSTPWGGHEEPSKLQVQGGTAGLRMLGGTGGLRIPSRPLTSDAAAPDSRPSGRRDGKTTLRSADDVAMRPADRWPDGQLPVAPQAKMADLQSPNGGAPPRVEPAGVAGYGVPQEGSPMRLEHTVRMHQHSGPTPGPMPSGPFSPRERSAPDPPALEATPKALPSTPLGPASTTPMAPQPMAPQPMGLQPMAPQPAFHQGGPFPAARGALPHPQVAYPPMPLQIPPPSQGLLHDKAGMLIGFLAGMLIMAALVALYLFLSR